MSEPLPLLDASKRLRKLPGRPRKALVSGTGNNGTLAGQASGPAPTPPATRGYERGVADLWPRLLGLEQAAAYLSLSPWTIREYLAAGILGRVELPSATKGTTRRVLLDRADLDALVEASKAGAEAVPQAPGSHA